MNRKQLVSIALFIGITLALLPNFYRNRGSAVEPEYYTEWQTRYDRLVVARLVKTRQDGFFSAGGLMGIGNTDRWAFDTKINRDQFNTYYDNGRFESYLVYKSNPGLQGLFYGALDQVLPATGQQKLKLFRGFTALLSAMVFGLIITTLAMEFGLLPGLLVFLFSVFSIWVVLPAGSIFWDFWGFYLPFLASAYLLAEAARKKEYNPRRIHLLLMIAALMKTVVSGFDMTTTVLVMATVPFIYHAILHRWEIKTFLLRFLKASLALVAGTVVGLVILSLQIITNEGSVEVAWQYILNRFGSHAAGNYEYFTNEEVVVRSIGVFEVLPKYLLMPALDVHIAGTSFQILYWHLLLVFALFTLIFVWLHRTPDGRLEFPRKSLALAAATWYSLLAPLSWYVLFRPHSFIHTHVNTMAWQMPFTLLGFTLCGLVLTELYQLLSGRRARSASHAL